MPLMSLTTVLPGHVGMPSSLTMSTRRTFLALGRSGIGNMISSIATFALTPMTNIRALDEHTGAACDDCRGHCLEPGAARG